MKDLLPVGSVVLLRGASKRLMIIGILQIKQSEGRMFDYLAVPYPEGYLGEDSNFLFNHEDINDVVFRGYENPDHENYINLITPIYDKIHADMANGILASTDAE